MTPFPDRPAVDAELVDDAWPVAGPHDPDTVASAALAIDKLTRYLTHATPPGGPAGQTLPCGSDIHRLLRQLRSALGRLDQVLEHTRARTLELQTDPTLYDDRRCQEHPAGRTVDELSEALWRTRAQLGDTITALGQAHAAAGHLGHTPQARS